MNMDILCKCNESLISLNYIALDKKAGKINLSILRATDCKIFIIASLSDTNCKNFISTFGVYLPRSDYIFFIPTNAFEIHFSNCMYILEQVLCGIKSIIDFYCPSLFLIIYSLNKLCRIIVPTA